MSMKTMKMPCVLTIIYSQDAHDTADFVRTHRLKCSGSVDLVRLDDLQFPLKPSRVQNMARSKLFVVLISPSLLQFLQEKSEEAFSVCRLVKPSSTSVIFCNGAKESDVTSQHKSVLSSFERWSKRLPDEELQKNKSLRLITQSLSQMSVDLNVETLIVPSKTTVEQSCVYAIFDKPVADLANLSILLEENSTVEIQWKKINPYVASFIIPDDRFQTSRKIKIQICHEGKVLDIKELFCEEDSTVTYSEVLCASPRIMTSTDADEQKSADTGNSMSFLELCAKYGLEQFSSELFEESFFDENGPNEADILQTDTETFDGTSTKSSSKQTLRSQGSENNSYDDDGAWIETTSFEEFSFRQNSKKIRRSTSLPSLCVAKDKIDSYLGYWMDVEDDTCYIDMRGRPELDDQILKPHERLLKEAKCKGSGHYEDVKIESLLPNHIYMSLRLDKHRNERPPYMSDLSKSQQELVEILHAFKRGMKTISEVERLFEDWNFKHRTSLDDQASLMKQKYGKVGRGQSFRLMPDFKNILSKPKRKESKDHQLDQFRRRGNKEVEMIGDNRYLKTLSKISNSSSSSHCSIISEHSGTISSNNGLTTDSGTHSDGTDPDRSGRNIKKFDDFSPAWVYAFSPTPETVYCPLLLWQDRPPTLPPRPPPLPARRRISPVKPLDTKSKPKVMPRRKLLRKYRPPSPEYITPNTHKKKQVTHTNDPYKRSRKPALLFPLPAWKSEFRNENEMTISSPLRKISAPDFRNQKPLPSSDLGNATTSNFYLEQPKLNSARSNNGFEMRKSSSYPQLRGSVLHPIYTRMLDQLCFE